MSADLQQRFEDNLHAHISILRILQQLGSQLTQRLPQIPKLVRATTGNVIWCIAPGRALRTMNGAATPYPIHTVSQACHHVMPNCTADDTIIHLHSHQPAPVATGKQNTHVLTLNESAIQLQRVVRDLPEAVKRAAPTRSQS
jgi:hypothetical protein